MKSTLITYLILLTLFSCSTRQESAHYTLAEIEKLKVYDNLDSLPRNLEKVYRLNLSKQGLKELPKLVLKLTNLQELNISQNNLIELKGIEKLKQLQVLNIGMNNFVSFPIEITKLENLKILEIWWNDIKTIPDDFYLNNKLIEQLNMTSLFQFDFETNLAKIHRFKNLKQLNLGNNHIPKLTIQFDKLNNLQEFGLIRQDSLDTKKLIISISVCQRLKILHLSANNIKFLPKEIVLLDSLKELNLFQNQIVELPNEVNRMKQLREITLIENPLNKTKITKLERLMPNTKFIYDE